MEMTPYSRWIEWIGQGYRHLPYVSVRPCEEGCPVVWLKLLEQAGESVFVLESGKSGRYTYVGFGPSGLIRGKGRETVVTERGEDGQWHSRQQSGDPLETVRRWLERWKTPRVPGAPKFIGGAVGYWSYDLGRSIERMPEFAEDDLDIPDYEWMRMDRVWIYDREQQLLYTAVHANAAGAGADELARLHAETAAAASDMSAMWKRWSEQAESDPLLGKLEAEAAKADEEGLHFDVESLPGLGTAFPKERFVEAVRRIQDYIAQGDVFQVNLSVRQHRKLSASPPLIYEALRRVNPSPYMGYLRMPGLELVSGSPELLVRLVDGVIEARPIAGTRRRGESAGDDERLERELRTTEKEVAEHIMLVDLLRNDIGRVAQYGSVKVPELMTVERYSHVMHLVSHVEGRIAEGRGAFDVIRAVFPGGTITGAPKIRTMEIIEELEPVRRGPYTGSIGWIDYNGDMELNIIIRTLVVREGTGYIQAGAGIVIDSLPEREYKECLNKARAMWKAVRLAEAVEAGDEGRGAER
ncbi:anthranilate synthase component I family protein [Paenibacillus thermoaerophilus]|uniref:Anthranilate synthase component I family protein n=1 Tax=Paenibacillus thermoaerophilus TaxID=1215385 RepID=A0ABW2UYE1_9BACL|nr:anthranilate synthase component I family protein [Paenibacillus thermoaerophilus]TMV09437.1 anthranilate synthase component I family protein [Paenibacillus thermoaerophilus]